MVSTVPVLEAELRTEGIRHLSLQMYFIDTWWQNWRNTTFKSPDVLPCYMVAEMRRVAVLGLTSPQYASRTELSEPLHSNLLRMQGLLNLYSWLNFMNLYTPTAPDARLASNCSVHQKLDGRDGRNHPQDNQCAILWTNTINFLCFHTNYTTVQGSNSYSDFAMQPCFHLRQSKKNQDELD